MHQSSVETRRGLIRKRTIVAGAVGAALTLRVAARLRRRMSFKGKSVLITGGSRGLGLELARRFAREGARLSIIARDEDELARARFHLEDELGADVETWVCDLRNGEQIDQVCDEIISARGGIDVLVNNAGVIRVGPLTTMSPGDFQEAIDVHMMAPLRLTQRVLPGMKEKRRGRIVNISSIGGMVAVPHLSPYVASKFAITGLSETMTAELAPHGIRVTTVCPGLMRTGSHVHALFRGKPEREFVWFSWMSGNPLFSTSSDHAARRIVNACRYGDSRLTITLQARMLEVLDGLAPGLVAGANSLAARLMPLPEESPEAERPGWQSTSRAAPSIMTRLADNQIERNNELDSTHAMAYRAPHAGNGRHNGQS